jgi:hypothetical protein
VDLAASQHLLAQLGVSRQQTKGKKAMRLATAHGLRQVK